MKHVPDCGTAENFTTGARTSSAPSTKLAGEGATESHRARNSEFSALLRGSSVSNELRALVSVRTMLTSKQLASNE